MTATTTTTTMNTVTEYAIAMGWLHTLIKKCIRSTWAKSNTESQSTTFRRLYDGDNLPDNLEDYYQIACAACYEYEMSGKTMFEGGVGSLFLEKDCRTYIYRAIGKALYASRKSWNNSSLYIEIDGEEVAITDIKGFASHFNVTDILNNTALGSFVKWYKKKGYNLNDIQVLFGVINGYTGKEIAQRLNVSTTTISNAKRRYKERYKEYIGEYLPDSEITKSRLF